jgi:hypothetical protein
MFSAVKYTQKNGNRKARDENVDPTFRDSWDDLWAVVDRNMVAMPGIIDVPVCSESDASTNWLLHYGDSKPRYYSYPCDR